MWAEESDFQCQLNLMQLDDNCSCEEQGSVSGSQVGSETDQLVQSWGSLPTSEETKWTWKMPDDKSDRGLVALGKALEEGGIQIVEAMMIARKVNQVAGVIIIDNTQVCCGYRKTQGV
jgi:hypothetical protein